MLGVPMVDKKRKKAAPVPGVPETTEKRAYRPGTCYICERRLIPSGGIQYRCPDCTWLKRHHKQIKKQLKRAERRQQHGETAAVA